MKYLLLLMAVPFLSFAQDKQSSFEKGFEYGQKSCEKKYCFCQYTYGTYPYNYQPVVNIKGNSHPLAPAMGEYSCHQKLMDMAVCQD